jgi:MFS family permease
VAGSPTDRTHRRKIFVIMAALLSTAGLTLVARISSFNLFLIAMAFCDIGFGMYLTQHSAPLGSERKCNVICCTVTSPSHLRYTLPG